MKMRLSICIPTYNRAAYIGETLDSIVSQATDEVEIVVSDNASTDNTEDIVESYRAKFPNLTYVKLAKNLGADANFMKVVESARGDYCWLFGSDDKMREGALQEILAALKGEPAVLLSNRMECDSKLKPQYVRQWLSGPAASRVFDFSSSEDMRNYFESANSLGAVFSFLSGNVVKRELWNRVPMDPRFMGSAYSHVFKLLSVLLRGEKLFYYSDWTVYCRKGNDSFGGDGILRRAFLDIDGYTALAETVLRSRPDMQRAFLGILPREYSSFSTLVKIVAAASDEGVWQDVRERLLRTGFDQAILDRAATIGTAWWFKPRFVRTSLRGLNRLLANVRF